MDRQLETLPAGRGDCQGLDSTLTGESGVTSHQLAAKLIHTAIPPNTEQSSRQLQSVLRRRTSRIRVHHLLKSHHAIRYARGAETTRGRCVSRHRMRHAKVYYVTILHDAILALLIIPPATPLLALLYLEVPLALVPASHRIDSSSSHIDW
jgi:hypothetical protein